MNCQTCTIDLRPLNLPVARNTQDSTFRQIYDDYITTNKSPKSSQHEHARQLSSAVLSLKVGIAPPVAFPTETVYGLGADATNPSSIAGIFAAKGRPSDNPLIVHVSSIEHLERCLGGTPEKSAIPLVYHDLMRAFWPGPLTILIPVPPEGQGVKFAPNVHPGQRTIGFRIPSSQYARFLLAVTDRPIAGPSANSSGKPSPTTAKHVLDDLDGKINFILDGGSCDVGVESTVVDGLGEVPLILRPGGLSKVDLKRWGQKNKNVWANVENGWEVSKGVKRKRSGEGEQNKNGDVRHTPQRNGMAKRKHSANLEYVLNSTTEESDMQEVEAAPRAPGMKYKHYAPKGWMILFDAAGHDHCTHDPETTSILRDTLKSQISMRGFPSDLPAEHRDSIASTSSASSLVEIQQSFTIAFLTSTSWPPFAGLETYIQSLFPTWKLEHLPGGSDQGFALCSGPAQGPGPLTKNGVVPERRLNVHTLDLGRDATTISNRLFATLRTCDDLECDFIFAEAPTRSSVHQSRKKEPVIINQIEEDGEFETVLERMKKAASAVLQLHW